MVDQYNSGKKTVCFNCEKRHPGCHNCEERQREYEQEQAAKAECKEFPYTENLFRQQKRRRKKEMRRY